MVRNRDEHLGDVVFIIRFRQLMANARMQQIGEATWLTRRRHKSGIDGDADNIVSRWNRRLPVSAIQEKVLSAELPYIRISPTFADPLITGNAYGAAAQKVSVVIVRTGIVAKLLDIDHAESALGSFPHESGVR